MSIVNIHEAKTHFSKLVDAAIAGEDIIVAKAGKPAVRLVPIIPLKKIFKLGVLKDKIQIASDFDTPLPEDIIAQFEGEK